MLTFLSLEHVGSVRIISIVLDSLREMVLGGLLRFAIETVGITAEVSEGL
jgi:hypothetical protein